MKTTDYFERSVRLRRPYLQQEWIEYTLHNPVRTETQPNGRIRYWAFITELGKYLRVVTAPVGETIHLDSEQTTGCGGGVSIGRWPFGRLLCI